MVEKLIAWVLNILQSFGLPGIALIMALETAGAPVPSEVILPFGGFLAAQGRTTLWAATLAASMGGLAGAGAAYAIGRWGGRPLLLRLAPLIGLNRRDLDRAEEWFVRRGALAVFAGRMVPGLRTLISLPAGLVAMPLGGFLVLSFLGSLPWCFALTYIGYVLGDRWHLVQPHMHWADAVGAVFLLIMAGFWLWRRRRRGR